MEVVKEKDISLQNVLLHYFTKELIALPSAFYLAQYNMVRKFLLTIAAVTDQTTLKGSCLRTPDNKYEYTFDLCYINQEELVVTGKLFEPNDKMIFTVDKLSREQIREFVFGKLDVVTTIVNNKGEHASLFVEKWANLMDQLNYVDELRNSSGSLSNRWGDVLHFLTEKLGDDWKHKFYTTSMNKTFDEKDKIGIYHDDSDIFFPWVSFGYRKDSDYTFCFWIYTIDYRVRTGTNGKKKPLYTEYEERFDVETEAAQLVKILVQRAKKVVPTGNISVIV